MRQKRAKTYRKLMSLYSLSFGFRQPYQVLVDSEICRLAMVAKADLPQQLSTVLRGIVKPMITQCCIHELYLQGESQQAAVDLAKSFERRKCNHREAILGEECIVSVVGKPLSSLVDVSGPDVFVGDSNKHRYVVATQSQALRVRLRLVPAVPIVHINRAVMVLEPPSDITLEAKQQKEEKAMHPSATELAVVKVDPPVGQPHKRKGPRGPNPLSVKKKATPRARQPISTFHISDEALRADTVVRRKRKSIEVEDTISPAMRKRKRHRKQTQHGGEAKHA